MKAWIQTYKYAVAISALMFMYIPFTFIVVFFAGDDCCGNVPVWTMRGAALVLIVINLVISLVLNALLKFFVQNNNALLLKSTFYSSLPYILWAIFITEALIFTA